MRYFTFYILGILIVISCQQKNSESGLQKSSLPDSVIIENYFAWTDKQEYFDYNEKVNVLPTFEKNRDTILLSNFINSNYDSIKLYDGFPWQPNELIKYLYAIDINGDDLLDIFYSGPTGAEPNITMIFLNQATQYKKIFTGYQDIIKMGFSDNKLTSLTLDNPGCCADPQVVEYNFMVSYNDTLPKFVLQRTEGHLSRTELVKNKFVQPKEFKIITDTANLRNDTYFLNISHPVWESQGNVIAIYKKNSKGIAYGSKHDKFTTWLYVLMKSKADSCDWPTFNDQMTEIYGWLPKENTNLR